MNPARAAAFAAACSLFAGCTWTECGEARHKTFLAATRFECPAAATTGTVSVRAEPDAALGALERAARDLPDSFRREAVEQALAHPK